MENPDFCNFFQQRRRGNEKEHPKDAIDPGRYVRMASQNNPSNEGL
jgi:hypothetical protein